MQGKRNMVGNYDLNNQHQTEQGQGLKRRKHQDAGADRKSGCSGQHSCHRCNPRECRQNGDGRVGDSVVGSFLRPGGRIFGQVSSKQEQHD